jgi:glyoxylase-like metal-dependent hydrolase (beta-lactamase superfamily II)
MTPFKMYVIDSGSMWLDEALVVTGAHQATSKNQHPEAGWVELPVSVFYFDHPQGRILFDTACDGIQQSQVDQSADRISPYIFTEEQLLPKRLEALKLKPEDINYVVLSHLHADHAGNLYLFNKSEIIVSETEFTESVKLYALKQRYGAYSFKDFENFIAANLNWNLLPDQTVEYPLVDGITVVNLGPGHGFGMLALLVELPKSGNFLLVSDAIYTELNMGPPIRLPGIIHDSVGYRNTIGFVSKYAKKHNAKIVFGHNIKQFNEFVKSDKGFYD